MGAVEVETLRASLTGHLELAETQGALTPWRLPAASRRFAPPALALMSEFTSGVRLTLRTDADLLEIDATFVRLAMRHLGRPEAPARLVVVDRGRELVAEVEETTVVVETPERHFERGPAIGAKVSFALDASSGDREIVLWLPHDAGMTLHGVSATRGGMPARVDPVPAGEQLRWVHHGSSISHGGSASLPNRTWPALAGSALGVEAVNLGFGGNAMLDPMTARAIAETAADIVTLKVGVNIVGSDGMRARTFVPALHGFLDLVREGHPGIPIVVISAIGCAALESTPGPLRPGGSGGVSGSARDVLPGDGTLTLEVTRRLIAEVVADRAADDAALFSVDGTRLLAPDEGRLLPDGLHPGDKGYALMAERFAALARDPAEPLGRAFAAAHAVRRRVG